MFTDKNILEVINDPVSVPSVDNIVDALIDSFQSEMISDNDRKLLDMIFSENPTQDNLDRFLKDWDIEIAGSHRALMLAYFMKMHPELEFNSSVKPRLKGLLEFYRFKNMKLMSHFTRICNKLREENIEIMLFKGGAMKALRQELPRVMGDIDVLVHEEDYTKAGKLAESMGYNAVWDVHSVDLHKNGSDAGIMDIHKYIHMMTGCEKRINKDLFRRARKVNIFKVEALVPCNEDMFFIALVNLARNLRNNTSSRGILYTLFDCKYLLDSKPDFDWNIVVENSLKTKTNMQVSFAIQFINRLVPGFLPDKINKNQIFEKEIKNYCTLVMYNRFFLLNKKLRCKQIKLSQAFRSMDVMKQYIKMKPAYFMLKRKFIRKNPYFSRFILRREEQHRSRS